MANKAPTKGKSWRDFYAKHPVVSHIIFIVISALIVGWLSLLFLDYWTDHGDVTTVPNVKSLTYETAVATLESAGLRVEIGDSVYDANKAPGTVLETWPRAGANVKPGREVYLTITSFMPKKVVVTMPLRDVSSRQALSYLESLGIRNVRLVNVPSQYADLVLGAKYEDREITPGTRIPVNALVVLEVGTVPTVDEVDVEAGDSASQTQETYDDDSSQFYD